MSNGLSLLDLADLPAPWRIVLRLVMREVTMTYAALSSAVSALPDQERMDTAKLDEVLNTLCERDWLIREQANGITQYRANIARKTGKTMAQNIWSALGSAEEVKAEEGVRRGGNRNLPNNIWNNLESSDKDSTETPRPRPRKTGLLDSFDDKKPGEK
jgi:hypothetical protein